MCGFSAFYAKESFDVAYIKKMNDLIHHRGPDGEGYFITDTNNSSAFVHGDRKHLSKNNQARVISDLVEDKLQVHAALGHRRLSIVDLSGAGTQPMIKGNNEYAIIFNGEIYNYLDIKTELIDAGFEFSSTSDTEVLLNAYLHWGKSVLSKLNGMFSFQIYNVQSKVLFCARDRFGVKPFYYWLQNDQLALASEIKQFTCLPHWKSVLNEARAFDFLKYGQTEHTNQTLFKGVYQLQPGHYFEVSLNEEIKVKPICWYNLAEAKLKSKKKQNLKGAKNTFKKLFSKSVELRLHADVPVGTGLSGGLDSSSIACEIHQLLDRAQNTGLQKTFTACTKVEKYSERNYVDDVLNEIAAQPHFVESEPPRDISEIHKIIWHQDEPFGTTSILAEWNVFKLARKHGVKVTLDGHGADESLAGYHKFFFIYLSELLCKGNFYRFVKEAFALKRHHGYSLGKVIKSVVYFFKKSQKEKISKDDWFIPNIDETRHISTTLKLCEESIQQFSSSSVPMQLHWCDRDSMAHSVESRAPFLDVNLVEFILACPSEYKIKDGISKYILRESLRELLPINIYKRIGKIGFATPEEEWITRDNQQFFLDLLNDAEVLTKGIIKEDAYIKAREIINRDSTYNGFAWRLICFANWLKVFDVEVESGC